MAEEDIKGLQDLLKSMSDLPLTLQKTLIVRALREASAPIKTQMEMLAPDDPNTPGSRIRKNIGVQITDQTADGAAALIGPTKSGFVGGFAERGTKHQRATPFIGPAFDQKVEEAVKILAEVLGESIEQALKK